MKYMYRKHSSKLATLMVGFGAGSRVEHGSKYPRGIAHLTEHMLFKGNANNTSKQLKQRLANLGGSSNAATSHDMVYYFITIPEENLDKGAEILAEMVLRPDFPEEELQKEREVVCQEIRMYDDDIDSLIYKRLNERTFNNAAKIPIIGFEDTVRSITRQNLLDFYQEFYGSDNRAVVLVSSQDHIDTLSKYFGQDDGKLVCIPRSKSIEYAGGFDDKVIKEGHIQNTITINFGSQSIFDLSDFETQTEVFNRVFGAGDVSRLFMRVREDLGLVYGIGSYFAQSLDGSLYTITTLTEPANESKVIAAVNEEIDRMLKEPATQDELQMAKNKLKTRLYGTCDTSFGTGSLALSELFLYGKTVEQLLNELDKVNVDDVTRIAKIIFDSNKYTIIGTGENS